MKLTELNEEQKKLANKTCLKMYGNTIDKTVPELIKAGGDEELILKHLISLSEVMD